MSSARCLLARYASNHDACMTTPQVSNPGVDLTPSKSLYRCRQPRQLAICIHWCRDLEAAMTGAWPEHALLLRDFANTVDLDEGTDALTDPAALTAWLHGRGLIRGPAAGPGGAGGATGQGPLDAVVPDVPRALAPRASLLAAD